MTQVVTVKLWGGLRPAVGDLDSIDIEAKTIRELLRKIEERYPKLIPELEKGVAVSINGTIYQDSWSKVLPKNADIYLLPRIEGG